MLNKIGYYLVLPIIIIIGIMGLLFQMFQDLEKAISLSATIIQTLAIFIGGLWAYHKFDWDKKAESAIKLKAALMEYQRFHNECASMYRLIVDGNEDDSDEVQARTNYTVAMLGPRNNLVSQIHLSCYLPKNLRNKIFGIIWLTLGNNKKRDKLFEDWNKFTENIESLKIELDELVSK